MFLDDKPVSLAGSTLRELLQAASDQLEPVKRVVVEVAVDGATLTEQQLEAAGEQAVAGELRLTSADPVALAAGTLRQLDQQLDGADRLQTKAADLMQADQMREAMETFAQAIPMWLSVQRAVAQIGGLLDVQLADLDVDGVSGADLADRLLNQLQQVKELLAGQDSSGLADALKYEWPELTRQWQALLSVMADRVEDDA
jgi:hypothetical protein